MIYIVLGLILIISITFLIGAIIIHNSSKVMYLFCDKAITNDYIDDILSTQIIIRGDASFDYVYSGDALPLGRVSAFLNHFGRSIYNEEPYAFFCKRSSRDNEFREYGWVIARTGIYISKENPGNASCKDNDTTVLQAVEKHIDYSGLSKIFLIGKWIITVNYRPNKFIDSFHLYSVDDAVLRNQIVRLCDLVIEHNIGYSLQKGLVYDYIEDISCEQIDVQIDSNKDDKEISPKDDVLFNEAEKNLDIKAANKGFDAVGVQAVKINFAKIYRNIKNHINGSRGHGYAAEYANDTADMIHGRRVTTLGEEARQIKNGVDRIVNNVEIQTKYYKTAAESIGAAFDNKKAIYIRTDGSGKMMQIEVPRDQYRAALEAMQKRIDSGQVPNVSPGENAKDYVKRGHFTYEQSYNIARAGTIDSLKVDIERGVVCCLGTTCISSAIVFALSIWRGASKKEAARQCLSSGLAIMGKGVLIYTLTMQLSRKEVALMIAGKAFTADGVSQGYKAVANPIFNASEKLAEKIAGSSLANSQVGHSFGLDAINGRQIIGGAVTVAVVFGPDVVRMLQGKISTKQLLKNSAIAAAGMAGAAAGQAAIPVPLVGGFIGGAVGGIVAKKTLDHFIEDDAKEMFRILKEEFIDATMLAGLSKEEFDEVSKLTVGNNKLPKMLRNMYQSDDRRLYARTEIMQKTIIEISKKRKRITMNDYDQGVIGLMAESA